MPKPHWTWASDRAAHVTGRCGRFEAVISLGNCTIEGTIEEDERFMCAEVSIYKNKRERVIHFLLLPWEEDGLSECNFCREGKDDKGNDCEECNGSGFDVMGVAQNKVAEFFNVDN
jgi:hypothetical protein